MEEKYEAYFESLFGDDPVLEKVLARIRERGMPEISVASGYGRLLTVLVAASGAKEALEIGALGGYSGICLMRGLPPEGKLVSLELRKEYAELAGSALAEAGYGGRVEYRVGDASASLDMLESEGRRFDFFFIDADKESYPHYLERCIGLARPGALIAADNTLLHGKTADETKTGPSVVAMREFNRSIARDPRLTGAHLPAYDGLALAVVKG